MVTRFESEPRTASVAVALGWLAIVLAAITLVVFAAFRVQDLLDPAAGDAFDIRYVRHPVVGLLHYVPGVVFLLLAPLQFIARIRRRHLGYHRWMGRALALCAAVSGVFALVLNFRFPAFGGVVTQTATVFFGSIFLFSLAKGVVHIRRKEVHLHREWMIRTFALALGAASIRLFIVVLMALTGASFEDVFGASFWLGFGVNWLIAEIWIARTRAIQTRVA